MARAGLKIGIDFDNTIVCYDPLFHTLASERGLIDPEVAVSKGAVRDALRAAGHEETWIAMQGEVYGARITEACHFEGVREFFAQCRARGHTLFIVSHKTLHPFRGPQYDLHDAARRWLRHNGFIAANEAAVDQALLPEDHVWLELTKQAKLERIGSLGCDYFIDDLPEFLGDPGFPPGTHKLLFDPAGLYPDSPLTRFASWQALLAWADGLA